MKQLSISLSNRTIEFTEVNLKFYECETNIYTKYLNRKKLRLHQYGDSIFCKFKIDDKYEKLKGIYCFAINDRIVYIGRCTDNYSKRINYGYGNISPRNCFIGGQSTNCRINAKISKHQTDIRFGVYILTDNGDICSLEKEIIQQNKESLCWNINK